MKLTNIGLIKSKKDYVDIIRYKDNIIWIRLGQKLDEPDIDEPDIDEPDIILPNTILRYTASIDNFEPYKLTHGSSNYETKITGSGPYSYEIVTDDITDLPTEIQFCSNVNSSVPKDLLTIDYICNTKKITDMSCMFSDCSSLIELDVSSFDTSIVTNMLYMFDNCSSLTSIDLSNFDTSKVTNMIGMFRECYSLTSLDLSSFDTSKVTGMSNMFSSCSKLTSLDLSNFDISNLVEDNMYDIFSGCSSLHTLRLDNCNYYTIYNIINSYLSTETIDGVTRTIYCKRENAAGLTPPENWVFSFID